MEINNSTSIKELYELGILSIRTVNVLNGMNIKNIDALKSYIASGQSFLAIRNFGKKSQFEVDNLLKVLPIDNTVTSVGELEYEKLDIKERCHFENIFSTTKAPNKTVADYLNKLYQHPWQLYVSLFMRNAEIQKVRPELSLQENKMFRQYHIEVLRAFADAIKVEQYGGKESKLDVIEQILDTLTLTRDKISSVDMLNYFLSDVHKECLTIRFEELCKKKLSVRGKHFQEKFIKSYADLVKLFDSPLSAYVQLCPGQSHKKTLGEIYKFIQEFKTIFDAICSMSEEEIAAKAIIDTYPYLSSRQRQYVTKFVEENNARPIFYILFNYLRLSEEKEDKLYSLYYGIFDDQPKTLDDLLDVSRLTRERTRQLINSQIPATDVIVRSNDELLQYDYLFHLPYICEVTPEIATLKEKENLRCSYLVFCSLVNLLSDFEFFKINRNYSILVKPEFLKNVNLKAAIENLKKATKEKYAQDTTRHINDIAGDIPNSFRNSVQVLLSHLAYKLFNIKVSREGLMHFSQNWVDVENELFLILQDKGEPMHVDELLRRFKDKYPNHRITTSIQLRSYLQKSERIGAIGKTSTYALKYWEDVYFGSIRDLLLEILAESEEPVHIDTIMARVLPIYPNTHQRSIETTMDDSLGRFVAFENGYFGLSDRLYDSKYRLSSYKVTPFEERMDNYKNFIEKYHRFPAAGGGDAEASLKRWRYNVENGVITLRPKQRTEFDEMIRYYEEATNYPRTLIENEFLNNCREYKAFIKQNRGLPTSINGEDLYSWFRRSYENFNGYTDLRYNYFAELINYIESFGFSI